MRTQLSGSMDDSVENLPSIFECLQRSDPDTVYEVFARAHAPNFPNVEDAEIFPHEYRKEYVACAVALGPFVRMAAHMRKMWTFDATGMKKLMKGKEHFGYFVNAQVIWC